MHQENGINDTAKLFDVDLPRGNVVRKTSCPTLPDFLLSKANETYTRKKISQIRHAVKRISDENVESLQNYAISGRGLVNDDLRRKAWPMLLNIDVKISERPPKITSKEMKSHFYYTQVVLDVERSLKRFPRDMAEKQRASLMKELIYLIMQVLCTNHDLHYYQGYHDICVTFLLVVGKELSYHIVNQLSQDHLRDFMEKDLTKTQKMLNHIYPILKATHPKLYDHLVEAELGTIFALSWLLTWFGHVLNDFQQVVRLYDFFLASHPMMPIYLGAAIVIHRENEILHCQCEMSALHGLLSAIPNNLPVEDLIHSASQLFDQHPPDSLSDAVLLYEVTAARDTICVYRPGGRRSSLSFPGEKFGILSLMFRIFGRGRAPYNSNSRLHTISKSTSTHGLSLQSNTASHSTGLTQLTSLLGANRNVFWFAVMAAGAGVGGYYRDKIVGLLFAGAASGGRGFM